MKLELFKILGRIFIDNAEAKKALDETSDAAKDTANKLEDTSDTANNTGSKWGTAFKKIGSGVVAMGKTVAVGIGAAATALGGLTVKALSAAGELEQNMGGSEAVFKEHAEKMQETAKDAYKNMGLSASDFLGTANKMGALFQGAGFGIEESATMSSEAMQRAADVASIMGIDTASAMEAIAGAAKGNFTMMDNLGVAMNDTTLQAYALEKGINKSTTEMTNQEKIGLAMEMFMEKTAYAAGNYAKENETLAGSLGTAKSALSNFISGAGSVEDVVSSFTNAGKVIVKNINSLFPPLMTGITQLVQQLVPMLPPLLESVLPGLIEGATGLINGLVSALPQLVGILTNSVLPQLLSGVTSIINALVGALPSVVQAIASALPSLIPLLIESAVSLIVTLCSNFAQIIQPIIDNLPMIITSLITALLSNLPALISGLIQLAMGIAAAIPQILSGVWSAITGLVGKFMQSLFGKIGEWIRQLFPKSADKIFAVLRTIKDAFVTHVENIKAIFSVVFSVISTPFKLAWNAIKTVWNTVVAYFKMIWNNIKAVFSVVDSVLSGDFKGAWEGIKQIWSNVKQFFSTCVSNIKNAFANVGEILTAPFRKGKEAIKKIVDNIKGFFTGLKLKFPSIKLPHFKVSPSGWKIGDLLKGSIPKLGIEWYAKAMNNPMVMTEPTLFGYDSNSGQLMGGGEAGSEVVSGTGTLMNMIASAVASQNGGIMQMLDRIINLLVQFFPEMLQALDIDMYMDGDALVASTATKFDKALGKIAIQKGRGR